MAAAGAAVGAFIGGSVNEFAKFDDQMRTVYSILPDISQEAMSEMEGQVKSLAVEMGRLPEDIIPGLYDALSSGIPQDNVFAFMETAAKAAVAGGADTQEVVKVLSSTINAFGLDAANTEQLADSFFNAVNKGVTTFPELAASMSQVTPTAAAMGLEIEDVLAAITAMTLQGTPTAQAVTGINASLVALQRTTPAMETALKNLGYETGQAGLEALGYQGLMEALAGQAEAMGVPLIELTGRMEGSAAMLQLTGDNAAKANELLGSFAETTGLTTTAFETMEGGIGGASRRIFSQIKVMAIDIGEQLESLGPLFVTFGPTMGRAIGAGLGGIAGFLAPKIMDGVIAAWGFVTGSRPVQAAVTAASNAASTVYAGAQRVAGVLGDALSAAWNGVKGLANRAIGLAGAAAGAVYAGAVKVGTIVVDAVSAGWDALKRSKAVTVAAGLAGTAAGAIYGAAAGAAEKMADLIRVGWSALMSKAPIRAAVTAAGVVAGGLYGIAAAGVELLVDKLSLAWSAISTNPRMGSALDKAGQVGGGRFGKAFGLAMVAGIVLVGIPALIDTWNAEMEKRAAAKENVRTTLEAFLSGIPTRAQVEERLQGLRDLPATLDPIKRALFEVNAGGVKTEWENAMGALESYLTGPAMSMMEGNARTLITPFMDESGRILDGWVEHTGQQITDDLVRVQGNFLDQSGNAVDVWVSGNGQRVVMQLASLYHDAAEQSATTYEDYLAQWAASGLQGPPIPESMWVPAATAVGEAGADASLEGYNAGLEAGQDAAAQRWIAMAEFFRNRSNAAFLKVGYDLGTAVPGEIGQGMSDESQQIDQAADNLRDILENGLSPAEQATRVLGQKWIKLFTAGVNSEIPGAKEAAFRLGVEGLEALSRGTIGTDEAKRIAQIAGGLYADGWDSRQIMVALAAQGVGEEALRELARVSGWDDAAVDDALDYIAGIESRENAAGNAGEDLGASAYDAATNQPWQTGGSNSAGSWVSGFAGKIDNKTSFLMRKLEGIAGAYQGFSPPRWGPLAGLDKGAARIAQSWVDAFAATIATGAARVSRALAGYDLAGSAFQSDFATFADPILKMSGDGVLRVAVEHTLHADPGALPPGTTDERIADMLGRGFEASGFVLKLEHRAQGSY